MSGAYVCDHCNRFVVGSRPLHSISLNETQRWVDFGSFKCMALWIVKHMDGTDLLDIRTVAAGRDDDTDQWPDVKPDH